MFGSEYINKQVDKIKLRVDKLERQIVGINDSITLVSRQGAEHATFNSAVRQDLQALREAHTSLADHVNRQISTMAEGHMKDFDNLRAVVNENVGRQFPIDMRRLCLELASRMDDMESIDDVVTRAAYLERLIIEGFPNNQSADIEDNGNCTENAPDGKPCLHPYGHEGPHHSRLATPENVAKCLKRVPWTGGQKCQLPMDHDGEHKGPDAEEQPPCPNTGHNVINGREYVVHCTLRRYHEGQCVYEDPIYAAVRKGADKFEELNKVPADTVEVGGTGKGPIGRRIQQRIDDGAITMESVHEPANDAIIGYVWGHKPSGLESVMVDNPVGVEAMNALADLRRRIASWEQTKASYAELRKLADEENDK